MAQKIKLDISNEELIELYHHQNLTLKQLGTMFGIKSTITMSRILNERGISTNKNQLHSLPKKLNMSDEEFKAFLVNEYSTKSCNKLAEELNVLITDSKLLYCATSNISSLDNLVLF